MKKYLLSFAALAAGLFLLAPRARADAGFRRHHYAAGETLHYRYEDTDTTFAAGRKDGMIVPGAPVRVQEIRIPVAIKVLRGAHGLERELTISPAACYRAGAPGEFSKAPCQALHAADKNIPEAFSYRYQDDTAALNAMQDIFAKIRKSPVGSFLFYKMEDVHQMQESVEKIPAGMRPGQMKSSPGHERGGLGGKFVSGSSQILYESTETYDGVKAGYFKATNLGNRFSVPSAKGLKIYTNFSFTAHVALAGPRRGLLLFGEGQETAYVLRKDGTGIYQPEVILQRQFSIGQGS